ncbi:MAG: PSD1 and planctomycete cytochrome C domain-containing protein [Verrucomicrobiota bacterium]|nr:PSD1 and planctomycete cytochrome C domain-containing protein [Verrucomicrobiota bacterium]
MSIRFSATFFSVLLTLSFGQALADVAPDHAKKMARGLKLFKSGVGQAIKQHCVRCHGGEKTRGHLDLTTREALLKGTREGAVIVPGNAKASRLLKLISHAEKPFMPAKAEKLPPEIVAKIASWIDTGAPYDKPLVDSKLESGEMKITDSDRQYWAFAPLTKPAAPAVEDNQWPENEIDRFVLARLEEAKLQPNRRAQNRTLLRRVYYDLIGLPPTPEETEGFLAAADGNPRTALESIVDRLLNSPHYGERWGRHWLDLARYADSFGFEQDTDRNHAYHYRDFVIKALNNDMPYNEFVRWQIAGDEIEPGNPLAMMATGFLGAGVFPTQLTEKEFESARYDELDDMVNTIGTAMLGMTIGCARCHDHKFDPIPTRDYYRMITTFATTIRSEIDVDLTPDETRTALAKWQEKQDALGQLLIKWERDALPGRFGKWLESRPAKVDAEFKWLVLDNPEFKSLNGAGIERKDDGSFLLKGNNPKDDRWVVTAETSSVSVTGIRIEALSDSSLKRNGPGRAENGNFSLSDLRVFAEPLNGSDKRVSVKLVNPQATHEQDKGSLSVASSIDGNKRSSGWAVDHGGIGKAHSAVFEFDVPVSYSSGTKLTLELDFFTNTKHTIGRPRFAITGQPKPISLEGSTLSGALAKLQKALSEVEVFDKLTEGKRKELMDAYRVIDTEWQAYNAKLKSHKDAKPKPKTTARVQVSSEGYKPIRHHADGRGFPHYYKDVHLLKRGDPSQKQEKMSQGFLRVLMRSKKNEMHWQQAKPDSARTSFRRRALADWLVDAEFGAGQLLARVIVNRIWQHHLGRGIVGTPSDFGLQGELPTHPGLLDWLAGEFINNGWRLKPLHKQIIMSATYAQSAKFEQAKAAVDPENRLHWRRNPRRLEAEPIRDSLLAVSGMLDTAMFGKGTLDLGMKRRSVYFQIKRSKLIPTMQLFDSPEPLVGQGTRPSTIVSPQALLFMNNGHVREAALTLARRYEFGSIENAVQNGYKAVIGRSPTPDEQQATTRFIEAQELSYLESGRKDGRKLALADFAQVLFGLNEFVYVY